MPALPNPLSPFHPLPRSNITIPHTPLTEASHAFLRENTLPSTTNHCLRSVCFALLLLNRLPNLSTTSIDTEVLVVSILLHDMGWATTEGIRSNDTRFEVDGANIARDFVRGHRDTTWDRHQLQLLWDAIALHTTSSIAHHKEAEVKVAQMGIAADFFGPYFPPGSTEPGGLISVEEYTEIVRAFPRAGFKGELIGIMCGLCRDKKETTFDNFVGEFGAEFGLDGKGGGKDEFAAEYEARRGVMPTLLANLDRIARWDGEAQDVTQGY